MIDDSNGAVFGFHKRRVKCAAAEIENQPVLLGHVRLIPIGEGCRDRLLDKGALVESCELAGVPIPKSVESKSLVPILHGTASQIYPAIYGYYHKYQRMIRTDRWKFIEYPLVKRTQLFDLQSDPFEMNDLSEDALHQETVNALRTKLHEQLDEYAK